MRLHLCYQQIKESMISFNEQVRNARVNYFSVFHDNKQSHIIPFNTVDHLLNPVHFKQVI